MSAIASSTSPLKNLTPRICCVEAIGATSNAQRSTSSAQLRLKFSELQLSTLNQQLPQKTHGGMLRIYSSAQPNAVVVATALWAVIFSWNGRFYPNRPQAGGYRRRFAGLLRKAS